MAIITERRTIQIVEVGPEAEATAKAVLDHMREHGILLSFPFSQSGQLWTVVPGMWECLTLQPGRVVYEVTLQRIMVGEAEKFKGWSAA